MSEVNVQIQNPKQTVNINNPVITIEMPTDSISVEIVEGQPIEIQVQNPVIEVNIGGPCDCGEGGGGHEIQDEGTPLTQRAKLNFIGPGVTATDNPGQDSTDVTIPGGSGGGSYEEVTYEEVQALIDANGLTPGGWYLITDASGTDLGFLTYAVTEDTISVAGVGGYLNADFQAVGDYANTPATFNEQLGIWRTGFEAVTINYLNLPPDEIAYTTSSGLLTDGETFTTDLGRSGTVVTDNGSTVTATGVSGALVAGEIITGDISGNTVTVDSYSHFVFAAGDTITGGITGATAVVVSDDMTSMTAYMTSAGVAFDGLEVLDNGSGVTADMNGAATSPTIVLGDIVIWNLLHFQLTDVSLLNGQNPVDNSAAYTLLDKATYPETYVTAWDVSEFDFPNNWLQYRQDLNGNKLYYSKKNDINNLGLGVSALGYFQWGRNLWTGNISEEGVLNEPNFLGIIANITLGYNALIQSNVCENSTPIIESSILGSFCEITGNTFGNDAYLFNCILDKSSLITGNQILLGTNIAQSQFFIARLENCILSNCTFRYNSLSANASIGSITSGSHTTVENNILENGGSIYGITAGANCSISRNKIGQGATLGGETTLSNNAQIIDNVLDSSATISFNTIDGTISRNNLYSNASLDSNTISGGSSIIENVIGVSSNISTNSLDGESTISGNVLLNNCGIGEVTLNGSTLSFNFIKSSGGITDITTGSGCSINRNNIDVGAILGGSTTMGDGAAFNDLDIRANKQIRNKALDAAVTFSDKIVQLTTDAAETYSTNVDGNRTQPGFSDIPGTIDITGLTTLDCTAAWAQYRGIYNIASSNATEAIDTITNPPTQFPFTIRPEAGLVLTITGTAYAGIGAGQIALKNASYTLDGDKGEYIVLEIDPLGTGALIEKQVINGLI